MPVFIGENSRYLFFDHACATDCQALLVLGKDSAASKDYERVIAYDVVRGLVAYVTESGTALEGHFQIAITDLFRKRDHIIQFRNLCMPASYK